MSSEIQQLVARAQVKTSLSPRGYQLREEPKRAEKQLEISAASTKFFFIN